MKYSELIRNIQGLTNFFDWLKKCESYSDFKLLIEEFTTLNYYINAVETISDIEEFLRTKKDPLFYVNKIISELSYLYLEESDWQLTANQLRLYCYDETNLSNVENFIFRLERIYSQCFEIDEYLRLNYLKKDEIKDDSINQVIKFTFKNGFEKEIVEFSNKYIEKSPQQKVYFVAALIDWGLIDKCYFKYSKVDLAKCINNTFKFNIGEKAIDSLYLNKHEFDKSRLKKPGLFDSCQNDIETILKK
jgi:hypothetical protein